MKFDDQCASETRLNRIGILHVMRDGIALVWQSGSGILVYALLFSLLSGVVVLPPLLSLLQVLGRFEENSIVGNYTVLPWVLSGRGLVWGLLLMTSSFFLLVLFLAGLFLIFKMRYESKVLRKIWLNEIWRRLPEILMVSLRWSLVLLAAVVVLGLVPGLGFLLFLREHDINYYLKSQPAEWWWVIGFSAVWISGAAYVLIRILLRISLVFPIWVRKETNLRKSVRESWVTTRGHERRLALLLLLPIGVMSLVHLLLSLGIFQFIETLLPIAAGSRQIVLGVIAGGLLLFVLESFTMLCMGIAWVCAIWSLICESLCPSLAETIKQPEAAGKTRINTLRALVLAGVSVALVVFVFRFVVQLPHQPPRVRTLVIAHRGGAAEAPENSMEAYSFAVSKRASDMLEMDVAMTADGVLLLAHDSDLMRQADEPRLLADMNWEEMRTLVLKTPQSRGNQLAPLARLEDVLSMISTQQTTIVEFKHSKRTPDLVFRTVDAVKGLGLMDHVIFMSLDIEDIQTVRSLAPDARIGYFVSVEMGDYLNLDIDCIAPRHTLVKRKVVAESRERGIPVFAWTVDDPARIIELLDLGVDGIITNEPTRVRKIVDAYFMIPAEVRSLLRFRRLWDFLKERKEFKNLADVASEEV